MAINASIPLQGRPIDSANPLAALSAGLAEKQRYDQQVGMQQEQQAYDRNRQAKMDTVALSQAEQEKELNGLKIIRAQYDNANEEDQRQVQKMATNAVNLESLKGHDDLVQEFLNNPKNVHSEASLDLRDTWNKDQTPDKQAFWSQVHAHKQIGLITGAIKPAESQKEAAAIQIANAIQDARAAGNTQRVNDLLIAQKSLEKGQGVDAQGNIINLQGSTDATQNAAYAKENGTQKAKVDNAAELGRQQQLGKGVQYKAEVSYNNAVDTLDRLAKSASTLMDHKGLPGITGISGAVPNIPGSDASNAQAKLNVLKSQVSLGVLQAMREASKTGGALGNVSDAEGKRLEDNLAALDKAQSLPEFKKELQNIIDYTKQAKGRIGDAYHAQYGSADQTPQQPAAGGQDSPPANVDPRLWQHMTPEERALFQ